MSSLSRKITLKALEGLTHGQILWDTEFAGLRRPRARYGPLLHSQDPRERAAALVHRRQAWRTVDA